MVITVFEIKQLEVQSIPLKCRFNVYNSDVKSIPVNCVYRDLKVPLVTASVLFEGPSALTKKLGMRDWKLFFTCSFNKHVKYKSTKGQGREYIPMGAETEHRQVRQAPTVNHK